MVRQNKKEPDPVTGMVKQKNEKFFEFKKVAYNKDDVSRLNWLLKHAGYFASGKEAFNEDGSHRGFKCSAKCRPDLALGHNRREKSWIEKQEHIDSEGYHKTYLDIGSLEECYEKIFGEALKEYNKGRRKDRQIKNYLTHILEDERRGSMKSKTTTDNSRKPLYEFVFQVGRRDNRLDNENSIHILEEFSTKWMPEHYPNLKAVGIYLHADEFTVDPVTGERLDGSVHVHFDFIPVCHALTKEEQAEEKKLRAQLKKEEIEKCKKDGKEFDENAWKKWDWEMWRVENFGKARQSGMEIQSSLSGACAEMGFRTKGILTAQIQMEEAVRKDLLDMVESYGIKVDRTIDKDREAEVSIQEYKKREDNKAVLKANQKILKEMKETEAQNKVEKEQNLRAKTQNQLDKLENENQKKKNKTERDQIEKQTAELSVYKEKVENIDKNLEVIDSWNRSHRYVEERQKQTEEEQNKRQEHLNELHDEVFGQMDENDKKESELKELIQDYKNEKKEDESRKRELQILCDSYYSNRSDYRKFERAHDFMEKTKMELKDFEDEFYRNEKYGIYSMKENLKNMFGRVKDYISHLYMKFEDAQRIWTEYFKGKKADELRAIADDMDAHGIVSFEDYDNRRKEGRLRWQVQQKEEEKKRLEGRSVVKKSRDWDWER